MAYKPLLTRLRENYEAAWTRWKADPTFTNAINRDDARQRYVDARMVAADTLDDSQAAARELLIHPEGWDQA